ncbi:hypothetical protein GGU10DRAFT_358497 [Lentinula aff. detonsa]|uniref:Uncharacterized protein n=2 Tax=Lentinula TaxID=5352 RepID=A0AA38KNK3_9AGAR|nr:hypothetical protein GGU10DRAFT_358497 [Lentinula aff. detonsa]KAJ3979780.1 hypothetical protein F5890DRAFT_1589229 [Lentinula detonsa]
MSHNASSKDLSDIFPRIRNIDDTPPVLNSIVQGHHAPFYELGWIIPFGKVLELFGEPPQGMVEEHYNYTVLPSKWAKRKPNTTFLEPPEIEYWEYLEGRAPETHDEDHEEAHMIIRLATNSLEELQVVKEHGQELVCGACEVLGFNSEELKWYRTVFIKRPAVMYRNLSPQALSNIFPQIRNIDDTPPILYSIVQGHHAPYYELGWVIPFSKVLELLGEPPEGMVEEHYNYTVLPSKWAECKPNTMFLEPPEIDRWEYPEGRAPETHDKEYEESYMIIRLAMNSPEELEVLKEHIHELAHIACEALGLPSEDLKWYRTVFITR